MVKRKKKEYGWRKGRENKEEINYFGKNKYGLQIEKMFMSKRWDVTLATKTGRQLSRTQHQNKSSAIKKAKSLMRKFK